jgi:hypothetical protein
LRSVSAPSRRQTVAVTVVAAMLALLAFAAASPERASAYPWPCRIDCPDPPNPRPWMDDGSLVKERHDPAVYVIVGWAKLWVPSATEFDAMGYSWADVWVVADGTLRSVSNTPLNGTRLRERSSSIEWDMIGGRRNWGPVCDWNRPPTRVPNASLTAIPAGWGPAWGCL